MTRLALDPANNLGFARQLPDGTIAWGSVDLTHEAKLLRCSVLAALRQWLRKQIEEHGITEVHAEDAAKGSHRHNVIVAHSEKQGVIKLVCELAKIKVTWYGPSKIKLQATGSGRAKKPQMMAACKTLYQIDVQGNDDAADAIHILKMAEAGVSGDKKTSWRPKTKGAGSSRRSGPPALF